MIDDFVAELIIETFGSVWPFIFNDKGDDDDGDNDDDDVDCGNVILEFDLFNEVFIEESTCFIEDDNDVLMINGDSLRFSGSILDEWIFRSDRRSPEVWLECLSLAIVFRRCEWLRIDVDLIRLDSRPLINDIDSLAQGDSDNGGNGSGGDDAADDDDDGLRGFLSAVKLNEDGDLRWLGLFWKWFCGDDDEWRLDDRDEFDGDSEQRLPLIVDWLCAVWLRWCSKPLWTFNTSLRIPCSCSWRIFKTVWKFVETCNEPGQLLPLLLLLLPPPPPLRLIGGDLVVDTTGLADPIAVDEVINGVELKIGNDIKPLDDLEPPWWSFNRDDIVADIDDGDDFALFPSL